MGTICSSCHDEVDWEKGAEYPNGGWYCDHCVQTKPVLSARINRRSEHNNDGMCGCSACAAKADRD